MTKGLRVREAGRRPTVFLSHSHKDKWFVSKLSGKLRQHGVAVWIDEHSLKIGESLVERIGSAVESTDYVLVVLSENSVTSEWVQRELRAALQREFRTKQMIVLPVLLEEVDLPPFLHDKVYADFTSPQTFENTFAKLLDAIGVEASESSEIYASAPSEDERTFGEASYSRIPTSLTLSNASLLATIRLLFEPSKYFERIHERASLDGSTLTSKVVARIRIPSEELEGESAIEQPQLRRIAIPLATPRANKFISFRNMRTESTSHLDVVPYEEERRLTEAIIRSQLLSLFARDAITTPTALSELDDLLATLMPLVNEQTMSVLPTDAVDRLNPIDRSMLRRMIDLATRRHIHFVVVPAERGDVVDLEFSFDYADLIESRAHSWRPFITKKPVAIRVALPNARRTRHYELEFEGGPSFYVDDVQLCLMVDGRLQFAEERRGARDRWLGSAQIVRSASSAAHVMLMGGHLERGRVEARIQLTDRRAPIADARSNTP